MRDDDMEVRIAHNWCDRWCERCPLETRCPVSLQVAKRPDHEGAYVLVAESLSRAKAMLEVELAREGLAVQVFDSVTELADWRIAADHPLSVQAFGWARLAASWLRAAPEGETEKVVAWYHTLVPAKLRRAVLSACDDADDARGSAKVATLGLTRVIDALTAHCGPHPLDAAGIDLLAVTADLVEAIEAAFPNHQAFRRPGLDVEPSRIRASDTMG